MSRLFSEILNDSYKELITALDKQIVTLVTEHFTDTFNFKEEPRLESAENETMIRLSVDPRGDKVILITEDTRDGEEHEYELISDDCPLTFSDKLFILSEIEKGFEPAMSESNLFGIEDNGFYKYMDASTGHIRPETDEWLKNPALPIIARPHEYGYWIHVPGDALESITDVKTIPADLRDIIRYAKLKNCVWINLDRDGYEHNDLPSYEW